MFLARYEFDVEHFTHTGVGPANAGRRPKNKIYPGVMAQHILSFVTSSVHVAGGVPIYFFYIEKTGKVSEDKFIGYGDVPFAGPNGKNNKFKFIMRRE